jgi:acyl-ACP thioesterase
MNKYNQYHDETTAFHNETMIYFSQCTPNKVLSLGELLRLTSDTAVEDFAERNMSREQLAEKGVAILVSRVSFRIHRIPQENEKIIIHTHEEKSEPLQFVRAYDINSQDGEKLVSGISSWLLVDVNAHRIMPIKKFDEMKMREPTTLTNEHDCLPYGKIKLPEDLSLFDERVIKYSDLDSNGHTTNSRYGSFVADALPPEFRNISFKDFRLNYAKEAMLGEKLSVFGKIDNEQKKISLVGKTEQGVSFEAELFW